MVVIAMLGAHAPIGAQLDWAIRIATARRAPLCIVQRGTAQGGSRWFAAREDSEDAAAPKLLAQLRAALERSETLRLVVEEPEATDAENADEAETEDGGPFSVDAAIVQGPDPDGPLLELVEEREAKLLLVMFGDDAIDEPGGKAVRKAALQRAPCTVVLMRVPQEPPAESRAVLAPVTRGPQSRAALRVARDLAAARECPFRPLYVEPPIGADAEPVGLRALDGVLTRAFGRERDGMGPLVVVEKDVARGIATAHEKVSPEILVLGVSGPSALGDRFQGSMARRMMKRLPDVAVAAVRDALPFGNRMRQLLEDALQRVVPQLERESRVALAERVQSNSSWNFDFVVLISLSTLIAAMGLIQSSAAVVIGAMLVAPLMTPILGVGLALVHGNVELARLSFRAVAFGVCTAWLLGLAVGLLDPTFHEPSAEMLSRGWPGALDLGVAFVAGLAAAYATSRPNLLAALPGVAIAAALVPPIATSGLAASIGYGEMSVGAALLFVTNMVAIVLASALSLWAVGIRSIKGASRWTRIVGNTLIGAALVLAIYLSTSPPRTIRIERVPADCKRAIEAELPPSLRLRELDLARRQDFAELLVRVGGTDRPDAALASRLRDAATPHIDQPVRVRIVHDWEVESGAER